MNNVTNQADVYDHIDFALSSLDMFEDISENLINFAFNVRAGLLSGAVVSLVAYLTDLRFGDSGFYRRHLMK